jgi:hypothetical protein
MLGSEGSQFAGVLSLEGLPPLVPLPEPFDPLVAPPFDPVVAPVAPVEVGSPPFVPRSPVICVASAHAKRNNEDSNSERDIGGLLPLAAASLCEVYATCRRTSD